jgi:four helix bundle protein
MPPGNQKIQVSATRFPVSGQKNQEILSYKDLVVWEKGIQLASAVYSLTKKFPVGERIGLTSQMRRAAVSVPSNIAEGRGRRSRKDFIQFLHFALGSLAELDTQVLIAQKQGYGRESDYNEAVQLIVEIRMMLSKLLSSLKAGS